MSGTTDINLCQAAQRIAEDVKQHQEKLFRHSGYYEEKLGIWLPVRVQLIIRKISKSDGSVWKNRRATTRLFADELEKALKERFPTHNPVVTSGTRSIQIRFQ